MSTNAIYWGVIGAFAAVGFFVPVGIYDTAKSVLVEPERRLEIVTLDYRDGQIVQHIKPAGEPIIADWAAEIIRDGHQLCSGAGAATYEGNEVAFTPSKWTGDECPALIPGDVIRGTWEYRRNDGVTVALTKSTTVENDQ